MDSNYNRFFFKEYDTEDYANREFWYPFFDGIAKNIVEYFSPKTVLDAGCAYAYLVEALRHRGVEAYGIDISAHAIDSAASDIREYLNAQSISEPLPESFPKKFDLIISMEVLEHLFPDDGKIALKSLCALADTFIFTSTPTDIDDKNHLNVQQREYWAKIFAENSFYRDLVQPVDFICPWATLYRRKDNVPEVIFNYELCDRIEKARASLPEQRTATLYFDVGEGFGEALKTEFSYRGSMLESGRIALPQNCKTVRFDPIDNAFLILTGLSAVTAGGIIREAATNAEFLLDKTYYFNSTDPQVYFDLTSAPSPWIEIKAHVCAFLDAEDFSLTHKLVEKAKKEAEFQDSINKLEAVKLRLEAEISSLEKANETIGRDNSEVLANYSQLLQNYNEISANYSEISNSYALLVDEKTSLEKSGEQLLLEKNAAEKTVSDREEKISELSNALSLAEGSLENTRLELENTRLELEKASDELSSEKKDNTDKNEKISKLSKELDDYMRECNEAKALLEEVKAELAHYQLHYNAAIAQREELKVHSANLKAMYDNIANAGLWKITKPIRVILDLFKKLIRKIPPIRWMAKFLRCWRENGFRYTMRKIRDKIHHRQDYNAVRRPIYTPAELAAQRSFKFSKDIKFSILVPLYNTPEDFLKEMIESVIGQTYSNWELCLADGSDSKHKSVEHIAKKYAHHDSRIIYKKLEKNMGISLNTNACIEMSSGDYIGLFDHDDLLHPAALYNVMEAICNEGADFIYTDENTFHKSPKDAYCPHFKPDYAPDTLRTNNYICHFTVFKKSLIDEVGMFRPECDGSQDYDMVLRLTEKAEKIVHIPKILYYWRAHAGSVATDVSAKPYVIDAAHKALRDHLERVGLKGTVENTVVPSMYRIKYEIEGEPLVSIIIANKDHADDLKKCIVSISSKTTYKNYEIIVVENNSTEASTWECYEELRRLYGIKLVEWKHKNGGFNYSSINNQGVEESSGDYVILLNNDIEVISPDWIQEMLMFAQRSDVGMVGAKLYYPDDTIQHAGVGIGLLTLAGHYFRGFHRSHPGDMGRLIYAHNVSAVTAACTMLPRHVWDEVGGLDETFEVAFNDIDLCMRVRKAGYLIVFTPFSEHYHYESKSRGLDNDPVKRKRFVGEVTRFQTKWRRELDAGDPYYNPNFSLDSEDFSIK